MEAGSATVCGHGNTQPVQWCVCVCVCFWECVDVYVWVCVYLFEYVCVFMEVTCVCFCRVFECVCVGVFGIVCVFVWVCFLECVGLFGSVCVVSGPWGPGGLAAALGEKLFYRGRLSSVSSSLHRSRFSSMAQINVVLCLLTAARNALKSLGSFCLSLQ